MEEVRKFYLVLRDEPLLKATKRHETKDEAVAEAKRLAQKERNRFFVAEIVCVVHLAEAPVHVIEV